MQKEGVYKLRAPGNKLVNRTLVKGVIQPFIGVFYTLLDCTKIIDRADAFNLRDEFLQTQAIPSLNIQTAAP